MAKNNFPQIDTEQLVAAIRNAELQTSAKIRIHVESRCWGDALKRSKKIFKKLKMHQTRQRNGILLYLSLRSRKYAIWGDTGIAAKVPQDFWENALADLHPYFEKNSFNEGLCLGVSRLAEKLQLIFPYNARDENELADNVSFDEDNNK